MKYKKIILLILDGCGIGEQDDYLEFQNIQTNTVGNIYKKIPKFRLPFLESMGLGQLLNLPSKTSNHIYSWYGKMKQQTLGNDTFAGVWEMLGIIFYTRFVSNMQSLDAILINKIKEECETSVICNLYISGYIALDKYFHEHQSTKLPIFYLSDDGVILLAAHENVISTGELNKIAEKISKSLFNSGFARIITRPFTGEPGNFIRNESERKDFLLVNIPPSSLIGDLIDHGVSVRLTKHLNRILNYPKGANILQDQYNNNKELFSLISSDTQNGFDLQFYVIPDTDNFGHKKNLEGFANSLIGIDNWLQKYVEMLKDNDLLIITADHGCDPTVNLRGHCREYVPLLIYTKKTTNSINIGVRNTFSDIGQTIAFNFNLPPLSNGKIIYEIF